MAIGHKCFQADNIQYSSKIVGEYHQRPFALHFFKTAHQKVLPANILLGNGDAHIKNWSVIYADRHNAQLAPAYDVVSTLVYMANERTQALNLGKNKDWYVMRFAHFKAWAQRLDLDWRVIEYQLAASMQRARETWPSLLAELPMNESHKNRLRTHWQNLDTDFGID